MRTGIFKTKWFVAMITIFLIVIVYSLARELYNRYQINQQIKKLQQQVDQYQSQNDQMLQLINYFKTPEYQERQARELLNLQKPGEFAVALPPQPDQNPPAPSPTPQEIVQSNLQQWWNYFFGRR